MSHLVHGALIAAGDPAAEEADVARRTAVGGDQNREAEGSRADGPSGSGLPSAPVPAGELPQNRSGRLLDPPNANETQTQTAQPPTAHRDFCFKVGIDQTTPFEATKGGFYEEIESACKYHSYQYWFIASLINTLHLSQIIIGATATALGGAGAATQATQKRTTAITVLTTIMTVIAAILVYFKSRGQPNRVRQLRNDLRKVCEYARFMEIKFRDPGFGPSVDDALDKVKSLYDSARATAEINYPDTWSTLPGSSGKQASIP